MSKREALGLPPLKPGTTECLMCERKFHSWDVRQNKRCPECQKQLKREAMEIEEVYWDDLDTTVIDLEPDYYDFVHDCLDLATSMDKL